MFVSQIIDEVLDILGTTDRVIALRKLTQAVQALMQSGHYYHLNAEVDICTGWDGMTVTLPRGIEVPLAVNVDGSPTYFRGRLFQYSVNKGGMYNPVQWAWDDRGMVATQMDIRQPSQLIAVAENEGDAGKFIRVIGTDANNRDLRAQLDNGTGVDGALIRIRALSEFPYGTIQPDGVTISTRTAAVEPVYVFLSEVGVFPFQSFQSGQSVVYDSYAGGPEPGGLTLKQSYYAHSIDNARFSLHQNKLDSLSGINPVYLLNNFSTFVTLSDTRTISAYSGVSISNFRALNVENGSEVTFTKISQQTPLPSPLEENTVYFVRQIKASNVSDFSFELYNTSTDAINGQNIINLIGSTIGTVIAKMYIRQKMTAQTKLVFSTTTGYSTGDVVQANTAGGVLPQPLIVGQNYYAHILDGDLTPLSLHLTYADSISGENPINLTTSGSGNNSIAKLLQSTTTTGTRNNITTNGFSLPAPQGQGAIVRALASGPVTGASFITAGSGYTNATASLSDLGGYNYTSTPTITLLGGSFTTAAQLTAQMTTVQTLGGGTMQYVSGVTIVNAGSGYSSINLPKVVFTGGLGPGGVHARADLVINGAGIVTNLSFIPYGSGASVSITVNTISKVPNGIIINQSGSGYVYPPRLTISAPNIDPPLTSATSHSITTGSKTFVVNVPSTSSSIVVNSNVRASSTANSLNFVEGLVTAYSGTSMTINATVIGGSGTNLTSWSIALATDPALTQCVGVLSITPSFLADYIVENGGFGYNNAPAITISDAGEGSGAIATAVIDRFGIGKINVLTGGAGYTPNPTAVISDSNGGTGYGATATVVTSAGVIQSVTITNCGIGYSSPTITILPAGTSLGTFSFEYTSVIAKIDPVAKGTGYTTAPLITVNPSTGVFVQFSSLGTIPAPLVQGTSYRAEYPATGSSFTVKNADFSDVNITSSGSGTFYTVLSHSFSVGFTDIWNGDFSEITTTEVRVQSQYELPATIPPISSSQSYYLKRITNTSAQLYSDVNTTSLIRVNGFGIGQTYFALPFNASVRNFNNEFNISKIDYLKTGNIVKFKSSGTLPAPLDPSTFYSIEISGERIIPKSIVTSNPIVLTNLGNSSDVSLVFSTRASCENPENIIVDNSMLQTGDKVAVRVGTDYILPYPLNETTSYFASRSGKNSIKLFYSLSDIPNGNPVAFTEVGQTLESTFFIDSIKEPTLVKLVSHVEKPVTAGYVSLYAFDYGRSNDMALIGQYHPNETNPKYRRVRIGKPCAWVRMIYRVRAPELASEYDYIPIENPRAIIAAVHAVDLEDKDFLDQAQRYWQVASAYLRNENESMDGHAMQTPQINNLTYGDGSDPVMF